MKQPQKTTFVFIILGSLLLTACGGFNVWPFGGNDKVETDPYKPADSVEYACDANKKFYVKKLENGNAVWLILPEREFALAKVSDSAGTARYSNKISTLEITGSEATLEISAENKMSGCKLVSAKP